MPPIPGIDLPQVISAVDAYANLSQLGKKVVVVGGGEIGVETGMHLSENGFQVTVLEMTDTLAADCTPTHYRSLFIRAWEKDEKEHGLDMRTNARVTAITAEGVTYVDADGKEVTVPADSVVISAGMKPKMDEALSYASAGNRFYLLGDCKKVANLLKLNQSALGLAGLI
jgi:pyruvate/2-oxoglutarate dehydrogenase complex dihydrolipoamide dehydrogenase (E3) component